MSGGESAQKHSQVKISGDGHTDVAAGGQGGAEQHKEQQHPQKRREIDVETFPQSRFVMAVQESEPTEKCGDWQDAEESSIQSCFA